MGDNSDIGSPQKTKIGSDKVVNEKWIQRSLIAPLYPFCSLFSKIYLYEIFFCNGFTTCFINGLRIMFLDSEAP